VSHVFGEYEVKVKTGYVFDIHDIRWNMYSVHKLIFAAFLSGILSSVIGMGGGMIYVTVLLSLNLHPSVSTSTATLFNFFSSLSNAVFAILSNQVYYEFAIWMLMSTSFGTVVGLYIIKDLVETTNKTSIVVFLLVGVLALSILLMGMIDFMDLEGW